MEILKITDGTTTIDLLDKTKSFLLNNWRPQVPGFKGAGTFRDSPLADGRRMIDYRFENVIDVFNMKVRSEDQDTLIEETQELRRLLVKAVDYWRTNWQLEPVWIEAQASCETNKRYSIIFSWRTPEDDNPYSQPFLQIGKGAVMDEFTIAIEHGHWLANQPGTGACVESAGYGDFCFPSYLNFDGDTSEIEVLDNAAIQNLPVNAAGFTAEAWIFPNTAGEGNTGIIIEKNNWTFELALVGGDIVIEGNIVNLAGASANSQSTEALAAQTWAHVAMTYEDTVNRVIRLWINGVEVTYAIQVASGGGYVSDVGDDLHIGNNAGGTRGFDGRIGWTRLSDTLKYNVDFTPPPRCTLSDIFAETVAQWIYEGSGNAIDNMEGTAAIDGTAANITWACDCERFYGNVEIGCSPAYLEFNGDTSEIDCGSDAAIDDLALGDFTAESWIKANSFGEGNLGRIIEKRGAAANVGWVFLVSNVNGIRFFIDGATNGDATSGLDDFSIDGNWHHIAVVFDGSATLTPRIFIDGQEVTYTSQISAIAPVADNAVDLIIGNSDAGTFCFDGDIGWTRISDNLRYTANFTPPARCTLPNIDGDTVAVWIYEGFGANADNLEGSAALDGAIANAVWACDCEDVTQFDVLAPVCTSSQSPSTGEFVNIVNKRNDANLTHIWFDDAGVFSANLIFETANYDLLPPVPAVNDAAYFVINSTTPDSGPFNNLVFNFLTAQVDLTIAWEYWNGAWVALTNHDNTANDGNPGGQPFDSSGNPRSVHWIPPADWVVSTVNGVIGYMVRARVSAIGASPAPPVQNLGSAAGALAVSQIHSVTWPFTEIDDGDIKGDIPAINLIRLNNWSDGDAVTFHTNKVIVGLRSASRDDPFAGGTIFEAFFNLGNEQLTPFTATAVGANTAFANDIEAPSGRVALYNPAGVEAMADRITLTLFNTAARSTAGRFRALLRGYQTGGAAGEIELELAIDLQDLGVEVSVSKIVATQNLLDWQLFDFGNINFPGAGLINDTDQINDVDFRIRASAASGTPTFTFVDLILIPVDEFSAEFTDFDSANGGFIGRHSSVGRVVLDLDSVTLPKRRVRAPLSEVNTIAIPTWEINAAGEVILQANADQRYWFLAARGDGSGDLFWEPWLFHSVWLNANQQYLSMRGSR